MSFLLNDSAETLHYAESGPRTRWRALLCGFGLTAFGMSAVFIEMLCATQRAVTGIDTGSAVLAVCGLVSFWSFGAFVLWLALFSPVHTLVFDVPTRRITHRRHAPLMRFREATHGFGDIAKTALEETTSEDGDTSFLVVLTLVNGKILRIGVFSEPSAAADCLRRVRELTAHA